jgi:hypothetical protein
VILLTLWLCGVSAAARAWNKRPFPESDDETKLTGKELRRLRKPPRDQKETDQYQQWSDMLRGRLVNVLKLIDGPTHWHACKPPAWYAFVERGSEESTAVSSSVF